jgi:catechol 2,3-dioxygenase-like lactoylglutathione lyase family enzyme
MDLNQVTFPATDLSKSIPFYQTLGCKLIVHTHARYARFECPNGEATFSLHQVDEAPAGPGVYVYFECENLDEKVAELSAKGMVFQSPPTDQSWLWREARLMDPDGNQLVLYFAGNNRKNPPWRLKE